MNIYKGVESIKNITNPVLTIGTFDGVHIGHQKIIHQLNEEAAKVNGESALLTFFPHPRMVLQPNDHSLKLIQTQEEKINKLAEFGLKNLIVIPFTKEFSNLSAIDFVESILVEKLKIKKIIIGYDHQFGNNREGDLKFLVSMAPKYGFEVIEIPAQEINDVNVSSTQVRNAVLNGDIHIANKYLGQAFKINGTVVKGKQLGRTIGFPTANVKIEDPYKIIPAIGVYNVIIKLQNSTHKGMMNIGYRPTISNELELSLEVHLLDFNGDLYNQFVTVNVLNRIRNEKKFPSIDHLKAQLKEDEQTCRAFFSSSDSL